MKPPILHIYEDYKLTGPSGPVVRLCRELRDRGWPVELACCKGPPDFDSRRLYNYAIASGLVVHDGLFLQSNPNLQKNARDISHLMRLMRRRGHRLIHAHGSWDHILAWRAARLLPGQPTVVRTEHKGRSFNPVLHQIPFSSFMTDHLVVLSRRFHKAAQSHLLRKPDTIHTVPGAVDCQKYRPMEPSGKREELGLRPEDIVVGIVARIQPYRRWDVLLKAFDRVRQRTSRVKLVVLGRGAHKEELLDRPIEEMGLEQTVIPLGYRREDYRDVLATLDAGMLLVPGSDGSCRAAMEMAAMGKPLLVSRRGVLPDIAGDGEAGKAVHDTPARLAETVLEMCDDRAQLREWGRSARRRMQREFSLKKQGDRMEEVYRRILEQE